MCDCIQIKNTDEYIIAWRAWVEVDSNIKEFNSIDHCFENIPNDGFQAMRLWYSDGTGRFISGNDWYFFQEHPRGLIVGQTNDIDVKERYPNAVFKRGKHIPDVLMKEVSDLMINSKNPNGN